jgi:hypothetical protein
MLTFALLRNVSQNELWFKKSDIIQVKWYDVTMHMKPKSRTLSRQVRGGKPVRVGTNRTVT